MTQSKKLNKAAKCGVFSHSKRFWFSCCVTHPTYQYEKHFGSEHLCWSKLAASLPPRNKMIAMRLHLLMKLIAGSFLWRISFILRLSRIKIGRTNGETEKQQGTHGPVGEVIVFRGGEKRCSLGCHRIIGHVKIHPRPNSIQRHPSSQTSWWIPSGHLSLLWYMFSGENIWKWWFLIHLIDISKIYN